MKKRLAAIIALSAITATSGYALTFEIGGIAGGALDFANGSFFDNRAAQLAELGASSFTSLGSSRVDFFPAWSVGAYAEADFFPFLGVRLETALSLMGGSWLALDDAVPAAAFDRYGVLFYALNIPLLARGSFQLGPGLLTLSAGPFVSFVVSDFSVVDRSASATITAVVAPGTSPIDFYGLSGGLGYSLKIGPGTATLEARVDWAFTPAAAANGPLGGDVYPLGVSLLAGYGFVVGRVGK